jgi:hypothetical protein
MTSTTEGAPAAPAAPVAPSVIGGVDTHRHTHYAAAVDDHGRLLGHREFPASDSGYRHLLTWLRGPWAGQGDRGGEHRVVRGHAHPSPDRGR